MNKLNRTERQKEICSGRGTFALACSCQEKRELCAKSKNRLLLQPLNDMIFLEKYNFLGHAQLDILETIFYPKEFALSLNCFGNMQTLSNK